MPIPTPNSGESRDDFLRRCMADDTMRTEYPDRDQRYAVCQAQVSNKVEAMDIWLDGQIGFPYQFPNAISAADLRDALAEAGGKPIRLMINSEGGDVWQGMQMYETLKEYSGSVTTRVVALAASAASFVAMAGDRVEMADGAFFVVHPPYTTIQGHAEDLRDTAAKLDLVANSMVDIYSKRVTADREDIITWLSFGERWFDASESIELGFADEIEGAAIAAHVSPGTFRKQPESLQISARYVQECAHNLENRKRLTRQRMIRKGRESIASVVANMRRLDAHRATAP